MKFYLRAFIVISALALVYVYGEKITEDEVAELISDYNNLYKTYEGEKNAPVSTSYLYRNLIT